MGENYLADTNSKSFRKHCSNEEILLQTCKIKCKEYRCRTFIIPHKQEDFETFTKIFRVGSLANSAIPTSENRLEYIFKYAISAHLEREVVRVTLTFTALLENDSFQIVTPTEKLMYLMITFMGPDSQFLDPSIKELLKKNLIRFYKSCSDYVFELDKIFEGKCKFENLYALFVDHFQAASYGDDLFSSMVLIPLAQKYDNKWRRMIWSEHASVLRFLNCDESFLLGGLDAYLNPAEEDESLIKCYMRALQTNLLRPDTVAYKIAKHHVEEFKETHKMS